MAWICSPPNAAPSAPDPSGLAPPGLCPETIPMTPTFSPAVPLDQPITRGEQTITQINVRKPGAGELRGLKLTDVLQLDVTALATLLPRISSPTLTTADVNAMDPADLLAVGQEVQVFFLPKAQREADFPTA